MIPQSVRLYPCTLLSSYRAQRPPWPLVQHHPAHDRHPESSRTSTAHPYRSARTLPAASLRNCTASAPLVESQASSVSGLQPSWRFQGGESWRFADGVITVVTGFTLNAMRLCAARREGVSTPGEFRGQAGQYASMPAFSLVI